MKIVDYSLALLPQEAADLLDDIKTNINFGKYQIPVVSTYPLWTARLGEMSVYAQANTWALMICTSDQTTRWVPILNFYA
jgi:hypothetical protein